MAIFLETVAIDYLFLTLMVKNREVVVEAHNLLSKELEREVVIDIYLPADDNIPTALSWLLINDGQDLRQMPAAPGVAEKGFQYILEQLYADNAIAPLFCVGIHAGTDRKNEYGTSGQLDYKGRGVKAEAYQRFIFKELLPYLTNTYSNYGIQDISYSGFSLGGLSAFDIAWTNPGIFKRTGLFSASLWWRTVNQDDAAFDEQLHRIMHLKVRNGNYQPGLKFFFETGTLDETADRNRNGIIDSIDDTLSLVEELVQKGYSREDDILYIELKEGRHDVPTWAKAFPLFLKWGWGTGQIS